MKNMFFLFLGLSMFSCSTFEEQMPDIPNFQSLTVENIETDLPVISLTTDADDFDRMFTNYEEDVEIDGFFEMYKNGAKIIERKEIELEVKGNYSKQFSMKSLGVKFVDKYDNSDRELINPKLVLPQHNLNEIRAIRLRNSGNDFHATMLKDLSYTQLAIQAGLNLDLTYGESAIVFVNNKFYGLLNLRTESNTNGMAGLYGAKKKDITLAKVANPEVYKKDGDFDRIDRLLTAIEDGDLDYAKEEIDLDNFTDYMIFQSYIANSDWPHTNVRFYAIKEGKFRFVLYDTDFANTINLTHSSTHFLQGDKENAISDLFNLLYADADFKANYDNRYGEIISSGNLSSTNFTAIVNKNMAAIDKEIIWQIEKYSELDSWTEWYTDCSRLLEMFAEREQQMMKDF